MELVTPGLAAGLAGCGGPPEEEEGTNPLEVETATGEATEEDAGTGQGAATEAGDTPATGTGDDALGNGTATVTDAPGNGTGSP
ncbi:hypothetical protein [Halorarum salinum]|uniref:Uncharacterized protein n=1 Tax=Halorarum salinum TaxID=2743089 RepID=A0A7D5QJN6_9EURY|nr:hypothetical protein [Halobaculum salinum]QLG64142.1 hypothetical protein HUG12_20340 [Halobaculum salinum]